MKKHTLITIENDYHSTTANDFWKEDINYLVNELNLCCEIKNSNYINIVEQEQRYSSNKEDYKNSIHVEAKGYSQGDWQNYVVYYNEKELKTPQQRTYFSSLLKQLEKTFTHKNNYQVGKCIVVTIDGEEYKGEDYDYTTFCIDHVEFPEEEDIKEAYISIYSKDFDKIQINVG